MPHLFKSILYIAAKIYKCTSTLQTICQLQFQDRWYLWISIPIIVVSLESVWPECGRSVFLSPVGSCQTQKHDTCCVPD